MKKELQEIEESLEAIIHVESQRAILKKYWIRKCYSMMVYMDSGFKNSLPSTTDWLSRWLKKKEVYPNGWLKERHPWSRKTTAKEPSPTNIDR